MDNLSKIKKFSKNFHRMLSFLLAAVPIYYVLYWALINFLPETPITVNVQPTPMSPNELPPALQIAGFAASGLPLSALIYGLLNLRRLFAFYKEGVIFSYAHVAIFKKISGALLAWVLFSIVYESAKSVIFSAGNPPGSRVISVGFSSAEITTLMVGAMVMVIARVMDEGRILNEEQELTI